MVRSVHTGRSPNSSFGATGVTLGPGSGTWGSLSDENAKEGIAPVRGREVLAALADLPVSTWQYESEPGDGVHMGPTAQDFADAFRLGPDRKRITTVDADGVALAAIKGLQSKLGSQRSRIAELERTVARLARTEAHRRGR